MRRRLPDRTRRTEDDDLLGTEPDDLGPHRRQEIVAGGQEERTAQRSTRQCIWEIRARCQVDRGSRRVRCLRDRDGRVVAVNPGDPHDRPGREGIQGRLDGRGYDGLTSKDHDPGRCKAPKFGRHRVRDLVIHKEHGGAFLARRGGTAECVGEVRACRDIGDGNPGGERGRRDRGGSRVAVRTGDSLDAAGRERFEGGPHRARNDAVSAENDDPPGLETAEFLPCGVRDCRCRHEERRCVVRRCSGSAGERVGKVEPGRDVDRRDAGTE